MKTLVIPGLRLEVDSFGKNAEKEANEILAVVNDAIKNFAGSPSIFRFIPRGSADIEGAFYQKVE